MNNKRRNEIRNTSYVIQKKMNFSFPIEILNFLSRFSNIYLVPYSELIKEENMNEDEIIKKLTHSRDGATHVEIYKSKKVFYIFYNDSFDISEQRIRFTLAHELGHIVLDHFKDDKTSLTRRQLSSKKYDEFEAEANMFAAELLLPKPLLKIEDSTEKIVKKFNVSNSVAENSYDFIKKNSWILNLRNKYPTTINYHPMKSLYELLPDERGFHIFFGDYLYCNKCKTLVSNLNHSNYCYVCGNDNLKIIDGKFYFNFIEKKGKYLKKYTSITTEAKTSKPIECPICQSGLSENDGEFCEICGTRIYNRCTGITQEEYNFYSATSPQDDIHSCEHGQLLNGQARFCPYCGCVSTYLYNDVLKTYSQEQDSGIIIENSTLEI